MRLAFLDSVRTRNIEGRKSYFIGYMTNRLLLGQKPSDWTPLTFIRRARLPKSRESGKHQLEARISIAHAGLCGENCIHARIGSMFRDFLGCKKSSPPNSYPSQTFRNDGGEQKERKTIRMLGTGAGATEAYLACYTCTAKMRFPSWSCGTVLRVLRLCYNAESCGSVPRVLLLYYKIAISSWSCGSLLHVVPSRCKVATSGLELPKCLQTCTETSSMRRIPRNLQEQPSRQLNVDTIHSYR